MDENELTFILIKLHILILVRLCNFFLMNIVKKIVYIGALLGVLFVIKLVFSYVDGLEVFTATLLFYALFLPYSWTLLITITYSLLLAISSWGFTIWLLTTFIMLLTNITIVFLLRKILFKSTILFAILCFICTFCIDFWFFFPNYIVYGRTYAIASIGTGLIVNSIESVINFGYALLMYKPIQNIFQNYLKIKEF